MSPNLSVLNCNPQASSFATCKRLPSRSNRFVGCFLQLKLFNGLFLQTRWACEMFLGFSLNFHILKIVFDCFKKFFYQKEEQIVFSFHLIFFSKGFQLFIIIKVKFFNRASQSSCFSRVDDGWKLRT